MSRISVPEKNKVGKGNKAHLGWSKKSSLRSHSSEDLREGGEPIMQASEVSIPARGSNKKRE